MVGMVLADGTAAGTQIDNTATATYNDPNDPDTPLTSTSNTVTVTVAEVAGITVAASGIDDIDGGTVDAGDALYYQFTVTNVGNDTTDFFIPDTVDINGPGTLTDPTGTDTPIQVSYDGGSTWVNVPSGGLETNPISPNGTVLVRAYVVVNTTGVTSGDTITVQLGNTPGDGQNQAFDSDGGDVFTKDSDRETVADSDPATSPDEVDGDPVNGVREASATQSIDVGDISETKALVKIEKVLSDHEENSLTDITDDQITYDLNFSVDSTAPTGSTVTPGPLLPQGGISVAAPSSAAVEGSYILVSDAIPAGTTLVSATAPTSWTPVYTDETLTGTEDATDLTWYEDIDDIGGAANVTRVGYINTSAISSVAPGATAGTFRLTVITDQVPTSPAVIGNIAQVFGSSVADDPTTTGVDESNDPTNTVADESGDQSPSNYNETTNTFDPPSDGELPDTDNNGIPDDLEDDTDPDYEGVDSSNNNTGSGAGGEANVLPLSVAPSSGILNGPDNFPGATGPTDNNDDFTNKSVNVPDTSSGATNDPSPVNFTNTVQNSGTTQGDILLLPTPPATPGELPTGTIVTIIGPGSTGTATYEWSGSAFTGVGGGTVPTPVIVPDIDSGDTVDYGVQIDLPAGTPLSTDADIDAGEEPGFPVPITAYIDTNDDGDPTNLTTYEGNNITIDRVYTGFLRLVKESRILEGDGPAVVAGQGDFSTDSKTPSQGNIIEYRVTYTNISEPLSGTNNVILEADNVVVTEDGTGANGNNWAQDTDGDSVLDTSNIINSATDSRGGGIEYFNGAAGTTAGTDQSGTTAATDVTRYVDTVPGVIAPGESGEFTFQRRLN